jgi:glycosyltransferase involved in cell wall biosynthesis
VQFDLAHHVTYVKYSSPSFLSLLPVPFVWGPVGGAEAAPSAFWQDFSTKEKLYEWARATARQLGELDPFVRMTAQRSAYTWTTTAESADRVQALGAKQVGVLIESGLRSEDVQQLSQHPMPETDTIRFISMGRLLHWKGFHLGVRAFAKADLPNADYWILGEGPQRQRLEDLANSLGVGDRIKFWGRLPRDKTLETLGQCHVLVHPSLHDSGGWVCLEAMAASRPVICLALGGPKVQVSEAGGFVIPAHTPDQAINEMAQAMQKLAENPALRQQLGQAGHQHLLKHLTWDSKRQTLHQLYQQLATTSPTTVNAS